MIIDGYLPNAFLLDFLLENYISPSLFCLLVKLFYFVTHCEMIIDLNLITVETEDDDAVVTGTEDGNEGENDEANVDAEATDASDISEDEIVVGEEDDGDEGEEVEEEEGEEVEGTDGEEVEGTDEEEVTEEGGEGTDEEDVVLE